MITIRHEPRAEEVRQSASHTLFVEGKHAEAFDQEVLQELLRRMITVKSMGPSFHVRSVAEALHKHHPQYYFLIDRDHHDDTVVENSWRNFPDPSEWNLLIWKRRELENYFLDPRYSRESKWLNASEEELREVVRKTCQTQLFLDAANRVIVTVREDLKQNWIEKFKRVSDFRSREAAVTKLNSIAEFRNQKNKVARILSPRQIQGLFDQAMNDLSGAGTKLEYGRGRWLELMEGSRALPNVVGRCFKVHDREKHVVQGSDAIKEVAKSLVRLDLTNQPDDFQKLYQLIEKRVRAS
jgi:hypothetical protein